MAKNSFESFPKPRPNKGGTNTGDATAGSADILTTKSAYVLGVKVNGSMPNNGALGSYTPTTTNQSIPSGYSNGGTVLGDPDLIAANIKNGVGIFGATGTYLSPFFGDGSDGIFNSIGNVTETVTAHTGIVIKQYTSYTLNTGHTHTVSNACRGMIIFCQGNIVINGILTMTSKAGFGTDNIVPMIIGKLKSDLVTPEITNFYQLTTVLEGLKGGAGGAGGNGGGGGAAGGNGGSGGPGRINAGGYGGGGGGGAGTGTGGSAVGITYAELGGGIGSTGGSPSGQGTPSSNGGGAGGGGGTSYYGNQGGAAAGSGGGGGGGGGNFGASGSTSTVFAGGLLMLVVAGNVTNAGTISSNGGAGANGGGNSGTSVVTGGGGGGGGSGGGVVAIYRGGSYTNTGSITVSGGSGGSGGPGGLGGIGGTTGSSGSSGTILTQQIS